MDLVSIRFGDATLRAPADWIFTPTSSFMLARSEAQQGVLRIWFADWPGDPQPSAEALQAAAEKIFPPDALPKPIATRRPVAGTATFGSASYRLKNQKGDVFTQLYYLQREKHLLLASYGCPWRTCRLEAVQKEIHQVEKMLLTVQFV